LASSHAQTSIAKRAEGYGMPGVTVDGQEVQAVYETTAIAVARARSGQGPTLIESKTYRFDEHNVGLVIPGKPYRTAEEIEENKTLRDPLKLYREALLTNGFSEADLTAIEDEVAAAVAEAIRFGEQSPLPDPEALYDHMYRQPILYPPKAG